MERTTGPTTTSTRCPDGRAAIEKEIADRIKRTLSDKDGTSAIGDVSQAAQSGGSDGAMDGSAKG